MLSFLSLGGVARLYWARVFAGVILVRMLRGSAAGIQKPIDLWMSKRQTLMAKEDRSRSHFPKAYLKHLESRTDPGKETPGWSEARNRRMKLRPCSMIQH